MPHKALEKCPHCGKAIQKHTNPLLTVDIIIEVAGVQGEPGIVLIERKNYPFGWAVPGGFVDYGEEVESAAVREAKEETDLQVSLKTLLGVYSDPKRDPRGHTVSIVYVAEGHGKPAAKDDAAHLGVFKQNEIPETMAFDHREILEDYFRYKLREKNHP